jgi:hypothetical protein
MKIDGDQFNFSAEDIASLPEFTQAALVGQAARTRITPEEWLSGAVTDIVQGVTANFKTERISSKKDVIDKFAALSAEKQAQVEAQIESLASEKALPDLKV